MSGILGLMLGTGGYSGAVEIITTTGPSTTTVPVQASQGIFELWGAGGGGCYRASDKGAGGGGYASITCNVVSYRGATVSANIAGGGAAAFAADTNGSTANTSTANISGLFSLSITGGGGGNTAGGTGGVPTGGTTNITGSTGDYNKGGDAAGGGGIGGINTHTEVNPEYPDVGPPFYHFNATNPTEPGGGGGSATAAEFALGIFPSDGAKGRLKITWS